MFRRLLVAIAFMVLSAASSAQAARRWERNTFSNTRRRAQIKSMHILNRPNRPGHFYGNTVRRLHFEDRLFPSVRELGEGLRTLVTQR